MPPTQPQQAGERVTSTVYRHRLPEVLCATTELPSVQYADRFALATGAVEGTTAEAWARALFGDVPDLGERIVWQGVLGLRLASGRAPGTLAGWRVVAQDERVIRLWAQSWFIACELVVERGDAEVSLTTLMHYRRRLGRTVWTPVSAVHRRLAPGLLHDAEVRV
ncbi:hypothetical protein B7C62_29515 [Kitasatospora albolonga]|uniref:DUF2867 domain-containing protein n=1 Tax=Kitasatospora albolonga TaxID=68173 RepID=A0ABC8C227_9ACTN|nr:hypothetical protein B7C62_29515 [Kitasatospora albolonga]